MKSETRSNADAQVANAAAVARPAARPRSLPALLAAALLSVPAASSAAPNAQAMGAIAASTGADVTVTLPTHQAGDVFLLLGWVRDQDDTVTVTGWTEIATWNRGTTSRYWLFGRRAASGSETSPLFNKTTTTGDTYAAVLSVRNAVASGTAWQVVGTSATGTTDPASLNGITPLTNESLVVACLGGEDNNNASVAWTATDPAALTAYYDESTTGGDGMVAFGAGAQAAAAATGAISADFNLAVPLGWGGIVVAIPPEPPSAPGIPTISNITASGVTAAWTASATGTPPISYTVQKSLAGANSWSTLTGCAGVTSPLTCNGTGLSANTSYDFRVVAANGGGTAASSTVTKLTLPGQPAMAEPTSIQQTSLTVNWTMSGTTTGLTYDVQRAPDQGGTFGTFADVTNCQDLAATSCNDSGLTESTTYWYRVSATNTAGTGVWADPASATTAAPVPVAPSAPGTPTLSNVGSTTVTATWDPSATGTPAPTYTVEKSLAGAGSWSNLAGCVDVTALTCDGTGLSANTSYDFRVVATNSAGSATSGTATQLTLPGQPVMDTYANVTASSVTVRWTLAGEVTGLSYTVQRSPDGSTWTTVTCDSPTATSCGDLGPLSGSTAYQYQVRATNTAGSGAWATPTSVTTKPPAPGVPTASAQTTATMTVSWAENSSPTSYALEVYTDAGLTSAVTGSPFTPSPANSNSYGLTGLAANTRYWMRVSATGTGGTSEWSPTGLGTTVSGPPGTPWFSGTTSSGTTVSWDPPSGTAPISSYTLQRAENATFTLNPVTTTGITGTSASVSGLAANTFYWFRVLATNGTGIASDYSASNSVQTSAVAQTLLATGSDPTPTGPLCPGDTASQVGAFVFTSDPTADVVTSLDMALGTGVSAAIAEVEIRDGTGTSLSPRQAVNPSADTVAFGAAGPLPSATSGSTYSIWVTPEVHSLAAPGSYDVTTAVTGFVAQTHPEQGSDSASTFTIDNEPLAGATWLGLTPGSNQVQLQWQNPAADGGAAVAHVVVLRRETDASFTETLVDGAADPGEGTNTALSRVVYSRAGSAGATVDFTDGTVSNGRTYVYRVYTRDACGNWDTGTVSSAQTPVGVGVAEGSTVEGAPMISIVNPLKGRVSGEFRVQVRVHSPAGIAGISNLEYSLDDGQTWASGFTPAPTDTAAYPYDTKTNNVLTGRTFEVRLTLGAGATPTLRARVTNAAAPNVVSNGVPLTVNADRAGDGKLLVRDNSSQLCSDCHSLPGHTSETTGSVRGSWATTCRDCHAPHGTKNIALIAESITPPAIAGAQTPKTVVFRNKNGYVGAPSSSDASYANGTTNQGPCQVCHTRTKFYRSNGMDLDPDTGLPTVASGGHNPTGPCSTCHAHSKGLAASCTGCHGDNSETPRVSIEGADPRQVAAPPRIATKEGQTVVAVAGGGAHVAHVNKKTWRSAPLQCAHCHPSPNVHQATTQTDVAWTGLASAGSVTPTPTDTTPITAGWAAAPSCTNYCHGGALPKGGGTNREPTWTDAPTAPEQAACGTCHALLPPVGTAVAGVHPQNTTCATCHGPGYSYASGGAITGDALLKHIDGTLYRPTGCNACHGLLVGTSTNPADLAESGDPRAAPGYDSNSVDTQGRTERTFVSVGAHVKHVNAGLRPATGCAVCHVTTPANTETPALAHVTASVTVGWTSPANAQAVSPPVWNGSTCQNYCHSSGKPIDGSVTLKPAIQWAGTPAALDCAGCHAALPGTNAHGKHVTPIASSGYAIGCKACHVATATTVAGNNTIVTGGGAHVSGGNDVGFDPGDAYASPGSWDGGLYTCASTYCHSNGQDRDPAGGFASNTSRAWNAGSGGCTACHQAGTTLASGSHPGHVNHDTDATFGGFGANVGCQECHSQTTSDGGSIADTTLHVNMTADVDAVHGYASAPKSCSTYCHSSGQAATASLEKYTNMAWGTGLTNDCKQCHGRHTSPDPLFTANFGAPNYTNGGTADANANSHRVHVKGAADCYTCHSLTVKSSGTAIIDGATTHTDGNRQVALTGVGATATYSNDASKQCSNVSCHGGPSSSAQWGATLTCLACHAGAEGGTLSDGTPNGVNGQWAAGGHGSAAGGAFASALGGCDYCHQLDSGHTPTSSSNPYRLRFSAVDNTLCLKCHLTDDTGIAANSDGAALDLEDSAKDVDAAHDGVKHAGADGGRLCWDCHDPHGVPTNILMVKQLVSKTSDSYGVPTATAQVEFTSRAAASGFYDSTTNNPRHGVCQACHDPARTGMKYWRWDGTDDTGSGPYASDHNAGTLCTNCHEHKAKFAGKGACSACHLDDAAPNNQDIEHYVYNTAPKAMIDRDDWLAYGHGATAQFAQSQNAAPAFPVDVTVEGCYYCHAPDQALFTGGPTSSHDQINNGVNAFRLANTGGSDGKNGVCLVCHKVGTTVGFDPDAGGGVFTSGKNADSKIDAAHYGAGHLSSGTKGGLLCWDCHDPHGDYNYGAGEPIAYMIHEYPSRTHSDLGGWGASPTTTTNRVSFRKDTPGSDTTAFDGLDYVRATGTATGVCQVCHSTTKFWQFDGDGATGHNEGGVKCVACHAHEQPTQNAFKQATDCNACHASPPANGKHAFHVGGATPAYGDTAPHSAAGAYAFGCGKCHDEPTAVHWSDVGGTDADPFSVDVVFDWASGGTPYQTGTTSKDTNATSGLVFWTSTGTCATYCHSDGQPLGAASPTFKSPTWDAAAPSYSTCTECHETTTTLTSNAHDKHLDATSNPVIGTAYKCADCHVGVVSTGNSPITDKSLHVNGAKNVLFPERNGMTSASYVSPGCDTNYCHSSGRPLTTDSPDAFDYKSVDWNQAGTLDCKGCHGAVSPGAFVSSYGEPNYTSGGTNVVDSNSHRKHVNAATDCNNCHTSTSQTGTSIVSGSALHTDGWRQVTIAAAFDSDADPANNYTTGTKTCSSTKCHGTNSPQWGATLGCGTCHGAPPSGGSSGAHAKHEMVGTYVSYTDTTSQTNAATGYGIACATCHAGTHGNASGTPWTVEITSGLSYALISGQTSANVDDTGPNGQTFRWRTFYGCTTTCHTDGAPLQSSGTYASATNKPIGWQTAASCANCHGAADASAAMSPAHGKHIDTGTAGYGYACQRCHSNVTSGSAIKDYALHVNGTTNAPAFDDNGAYNNTAATYAGGGHTCSATYCHTNGTNHRSATGPYVSSTPPWQTVQTGCRYCHGYDAASAPTIGVPTDTGTATHAKHVSNATILGVNYKCSRCHSQTVASDDTFTTKSNHVNGDPNVVTGTSGDSVTLGASATQTSCSVYCHSSGQAGTVTKYSVNWDTTALDCKGCHGKYSGAGTFPSAYGEPNYENTGPTPNSHQKHVNAVTDCNNCHTSTSTNGTQIKAASTLHTDGARDVTIAAAFDSDTEPANNYVGTTCSNVKCHGTNTPTWGGTLTCNTCHGAPPNNGVSSGAHAKHEGTIGTLPTAYADTARTGTTKYGIACSTCHAGTHGNAAGAPWTVEVTVSGYAPAGTTVNDTGPNGQVFTWKQNGSCATDCHSDGGRMQAGGTYVVNRINPTGWNQSFSADPCAGCHGKAGATTTLSLAHLKHVNTGTYAMPCIRCHSATVTSGGAIGDFSKHVDGAREVAWDAANTGAQAYGAPTCTNTYCHSNGQNPPGSQGANTVSWNGTATTCTSCHLTTGLTSGSHAAHLGTPNGYGCAVCHSTVAATSGIALIGDTASYAAHVDGSPTVSISSTYGGTYDGGNQTCSNVKCHGNQSTTGLLPVWGTPSSVSCRRCHGVAGTASRDDVNDFAFGSPIGSGTMSKIDIGDWTSFGHGLTSGNYAMPSAVAHPAAAFDGATSGMSPTKDGCLYCHLPLTGTGAVDHDTGLTTNPFRLANVGSTTQNGVCTVCHAPGAAGYQPTGLTLVTPVQTQTIDSYHYGAGHTDAAPTHGGAFCWDCHDPHGDYNYNQGAGLARMVQEYPTANSSGGSGTAGNWGIPTSNTYYVNFSWSTGGTANAWDARADYYVSAQAGGAYNGICQVCHTDPSYFANNAAPVTGHQGTSACMGCHKHQQPAGSKNQAFKGEGSCTGCHGASTQNARAAVGNDFVRASRHVSNGSTAASIVTEVDCILCHAEGDAATSTNADPKTNTVFHGGDAGGSTRVDLRNLDTGGVISSWPGVRANTPPLAKGATYTTERDNMDSFCMSCHDADGASAISVASGDATLDRTLVPINVTTAGSTRTTTAVTLAVPTGHGLVATDKVFVEPGATNFPKGVKTISSTTATSITYNEGGIAASLTAPLTVTKIVAANVGAVTRSTGNVVTVTVTPANHGIAVGNQVAIFPGESNYPVGVKTVTAANTSTGTFSYSEPGTTTASTLVQTFRKVTTRRLTPFNSADNLTNAKDNAGINALRTRVLDVRSQFNQYNLTGKNFASHHNLNQFTKRYGTRNTNYTPDTAWVSWTTQENQNIQTVGETAGLHCSDCHLNEKNAHGSASTFYMLANSSGNDAAFQNLALANSTDNCSMCHNPNGYQAGGGDSTIARMPYHGAGGTRCNNFIATDPDSYDVSKFGFGPSETRTQLPCLACHGGNGLGKIHGVNETYDPGAAGTGSTTKTYRFMGAGGSMRYFSPNGTETFVETDWEDPKDSKGKATTAGCYTISSTSDTYGGCAQHGSFASDGSPNRIRPLEY